MASPGLPLMQENTLTIISGRDVPNATIVNPIIRGDSFALMPTLVAPFTSQFAPNINAAKPTRSRNNGSNADIITLLKIKENLTKILLYLSNY
jgi:hypothetical protein